jgi:hypothetical protein
MCASVSTHLNTEIKQGTPASAGVPLFSSFGHLRPPYLGNTSLAATKYCVPLRLHRQGDIGMTLSGGGDHGVIIPLHHVICFSLFALSCRMSSGMKQLTTAG